MLIQVVVRLILYTDQFVSRKDQTTGSEGTSQEETRGIDNTVGTIHILRKQAFGTFSDPPTHYVSMIYVLIVSKNCHVLNPPTQSIAYVIHECPVGKESGLFLLIGVKVFLKSDYNSCWHANSRHLTELFPCRITIFVLICDFTRLFSCLSFC